jgi:hypothetical protein
MNELIIVPIWAWFLIGALLLTQGTWMFNDASKRGMNKWFWGVLGLLNTPTNLIVYLIVSRRILGTKKCHACDKKYNKTYTYCPHCGEENQ